MTAVAVGIVILLLLLLIRVPVAFALLVAGAVGILLLEGPDRASSALARIPFQAVSSFSLIIVPLFIFMGMLAKNGRMAEDAFLFAARLFRWIPGGLAIASIAACAGFAAVSGSSVATVASVGRVAIGEMTRHGYDRRLAAGVIGAAGTLGVLIPPSVVLVIYGIITGESIGRLLLAGFIPGILSAVIYAAYIVIRGIRRPGDVARLPGIPPEPTSAARATERGPDVAGGSARPTMATALDDGGSSPPDPSRSVTDLEEAEPIDRPAMPHGEVGAERPPIRIAGVVQITVLFLIVIGGIYAGLFTPIESAAVGAIVALTIVMFDRIRRPRGLAVGLDNVRTALGETVSVTAMAFALLIGGSLFTLFLVLARVPQNVSAWAVGLDIAPVLIVIVLLLLFIPMGMFLDSLSILLIAVPLAYPVVTDLGFSGIWFGILVVKMIEIGMITPPLGLNVFVVAGTAEQLDVADVFRGVTPFVAADIVTVALLFLFPALVLFLPETMQ